MQERFEKVIVDCDTPLFRSANAVQETYVIVTHKPSGTKKEFPNKTEFHGHWKKREGGWLGKTNAERIEKGLEPFDVDDFDIEECARLIPDVEDHVELAVTQFDYFIGGIKDLPADDYLLCIGGKENYRYDYAHILPYKGTRKDKPILFYEVKEAICKKYKRKIELTDGEEAEDRVSQYGWQNYLEHNKTGKWKYLLSYVDKDLQMIISPYVNYDKKEDGVFEVTPFEAGKHFCAQLLAGDKSTDNIQGLPNFTEEIQEKYETGKTRGIGLATAIKYLDPCDNIKDMYQRVVDAYMSYYGTEPFEFESFRGEKMQRTWLDMLQENAVLLYLRRTPNEIINMQEVLDRVGVSYES